MSNPGEGHQPAPSDDEDEDEGEEIRSITSPQAWNALRKELREEWMSFAPARRFRQTLNFDVLGTSHHREFRIDLAVVVALGSTVKTHEVRYKDGSSGFSRLPHDSICQLIAIKEWLDVIRDGGFEVSRVTFWDPDFTKEDLDILRKRGYQAVQGFVPNREITRRTLLFAPYMPREHLFRMLRVTRPALLISNDLEAFLRTADNEEQHTIADFLTQYEGWKIPEDLNKICRSEDNVRGLSWLGTISMYFRKSTSRLQEEEAEGQQMPSEEPEDSSSVFDTPGGTSSTSDK